MDISMLAAKIEKCYAAKSYKKTLAYLFRYFHNDEAGIYDRMLDIYIDCQIKLGMLDNATQNMEVMERMFPFYYGTIELALKYADTCQEKRLNYLISKCGFSREECYEIAKSCFYNGLHDNAFELFQKCIADNHDDIINHGAKDYLNRLILYKDNPFVFISESYSHFKSLGNTLQPGHIIYVDRLRNQHKINRTNKDPKKDNRPYMVWKTINGLIYAFPVTSVTKSKDKYVLSSKNYSAYNYDRKIKDTLVCIEDKDIEKVIDKVREKDFKIIINNIYTSYYLHPENDNLATELFMNSINEEFDIKINDIIGFSDFNIRKRRRYFLLGLDEENNQYKAIEVERDLNNGEYFNIVGNGLVNISVDSIPIEVIKVKEDAKRSLLNKVSNSLEEDNTFNPSGDFGIKKVKKI